MTESSSPADTYGTYTPQTPITSPRVPNVRTRFHGHAPPVGRGNIDPTKAEWEAMKPSIERLYWVENLPLKDVVVIMAERHGFHAT